MNTIIPAIAGTLESSDVLVRITPAPDAQSVAIVIASSVEKQFGDAIRATVHNVLTDHHITGIDVAVEDKGALDCVLRARLMCALVRAGFPLPVTTGEAQ
ncbi:citrate lyase acyl carrier protein [Citrobacter amalonaticus]|uniref:Citrate lyase acyl carrier protein n=1 Tax=Citrobacter amalonaticus TaxID=35703 RepID=A0A2S4RR15_CITAM|nr:citrate lyase acyl carrier protein [Citrobacter amalonaticus]POT54619.1 citrate lyase acyl carrier protein [Citrobacter amalonaticus]POT69565.1 citrate lyase acyl carrier protein [Citrobacter amalonaticus]POU60376.1 citrate lyase acyl carrier protein [Citrobacter amalonaticus]POV02671.1 citrate lyase acyl carrier protein [Citrobacter amalonaticus]